MKKIFVNLSVGLKNYVIFLLVSTLIIHPICAQKTPKSKTTAKANTSLILPENEAAKQLKTYKKFTLLTDTAKLSIAERTCITHLIKAAEILDGLFWKQTIGEKKKILAGIKDSSERKFAEINYGPWDRLNNDKPFVKGYGPKPPGSNFYPIGFDTATADKMMRDLIYDPYTVVREFKPPGPRDLKTVDPTKPIIPDPAGFPFHTAGGKDYQTIKYSEYYRGEMIEIADELFIASTAIEKEDSAFAMYLKNRALAMMTDDYIISDVEWLSLKSHLDIIIGPIENYEDKYAGRKTSFEAYVLVRDKEWGSKLEKFIAFLPELQANLPVEKEYKPVLNASTIDENFIDEPIMEENFPPITKPKSALSQLAVFDVVYYAGECNAGSKTIAVNLPNDERIQKYFGTRRSQLKNTMRAKFENIVLPISLISISPSQQGNIKFDAFFSNVMFHEVAHGLGVKNLVNNNQTTVREALGADYSAIEECKADVLGLYMVTQLFDKKELEGSIEDYYVTFVASVFRSVRFGASSAHGKANMIIFNTLLKAEAIALEEKGKIVGDNAAEKRYYRVDVIKMKKVISDLATELLILQGNGDALGVKDILDSRGVIGNSLAIDLKRIEVSGIPVDLVFNQGIETLGLGKYYEPKKAMSNNMNSLQGPRGPGGNPGGPGGNPGRPGGAIPPTPRGQPGPPGQPIPPNGL